MSIAYQQDGAGPLAMDDRPQAGVPVIAHAPATLGELMQGNINGRDFLVTLPVDMWTTAHAWLRMAPGVTVTRALSRDLPVTKTQTAVDALWRRYAHTGSSPAPPGLHVQLWSDIPVGKGMASSTADITAALNAAASALQLHFTPWELAGLAIGVEPSDGIMHEGCVAFDFFNGHLLEYLGYLPPSILLVIDPGGAVETTKFPRLPYTLGEQRLLAESYAAMRRGFRLGDLALIGRATTVSALINQRRLPKPEIDWLASNYASFGADGIVTAHSGVMSAILFSASAEAVVNEAAATVASAFPLAAVSILRPVSSAASLPSVIAGLDNLPKGI